MTHDKFPAQFPDFDPATLPPIPQAWTDQSWANEQCPAFNTADGRFAVWVDYADAAAREFPESKRFTAKALDDGGGLAEAGPMIHTDDWSELLAFVLGDGFAAVLRQWLDADEIAMVRSRNASPEYAANGSCASHDFCDANMAMDAAFEKVLGRGSDIADLDDGSESPDIALWNAAWPIGIAALVALPPGPEARYLDALRRLREEVRDWQDALCGEREGLDELCAEIDTILEAAPAQAA